MKRNMPVNHLRNGYSNYVFMFIKKYINELDTNMKIIDIGAGHLRNLKLFEELGFKNLYALDKEETDNPLNVKLKKFVRWDIEQGIPFSNNNEFDIVLCNYVLMFIDPLKLSYVINELLRVTKKNLIIETNKQKYKKCKTTHFKEYNFMQIVKEIECSENFELLQLRKHYEKITARRIE